MSKNSYNWPTRWEERERKKHFQFKRTRKWKFVFFSFQKHRTVLFFFFHLLSLALLRHIKAANSIHHFNFFKFVYIYICDTGVFGKRDRRREQEEEKKRNEFHEWKIILLSRTNSIFISCFSLLLNLCQFHFYCVQLSEWKMLKKKKRDYCCFVTADRSIDVFGLVDFFALFKFIMKFLSYCSHSLSFCVCFALWKHVVIVIGVISI